MLKRTCQQVDCSAMQTFSSKRPGKEVVISGRLGRTVDQDIKYNNVKNDKKKGKTDAADKVDFIEGSQFLESGFHGSVNFL